MKIKLSDDLDIELNPLVSVITSRENPEPILFFAHELEALKMTLNDNFKIDENGCVIIS